MIRLAEIEDWWNRHEGRFEDLDKVLPYVVVHRAPEKDDWSLRPLVIGACCFQAKLIGSLDVIAFEKALSRMPSGYDAEVLRRHREATSAWRPVIDRGRLTLAELTGTDRPIDYVVGIFPTVTQGGARLILTHSAPAVLH